MYYRVRPSYVDTSLFWTMDTFLGPVRSEYPLKSRHIFVVYYTFSILSKLYICMRSNLIIMKGTLKGYKNRLRIEFDEIQKKSIRNGIDWSEQNKREQRSQKPSKKKNT